MSNTIQDDAVVSDGIPVVRTSQGTGFQTHNGNCNRHRGHTCGRFALDLPSSISSFKAVMLGYSDETVLTNADLTHYDIIMKERTETV